MPRPRNPDMYCARCGACKRKTQDQDRHLNLVNRCKPCRPDLKDTEPAFVETDPRPCVVNNNQSVCNNAISHSTFNINNTTINHNAAPVNVTIHNHTLQPFEKTDLSHIPGHVWKSLAQHAAEDAASAVSKVVALVHFNPMQPEGMNVYLHEQGAKASLYELDVDADEDAPPLWTDYPKDTVVNLLIRTLSRQLQTKLRGDARDAFIAATSLDTGNVRQQVEAVARQGSKYTKTVHKNRLPARVGGTASP